MPSGASRAETVNVLFTSAGRRVELVRAFRQAYRETGIAGRLLAADIDPLAPALHEADAGFLVPSLDDARYIPALSQLCRDEAVTLVFPLIDPDIPALAHGREAIESSGARLAAVPAEAADLTRDKWRTYQWLTENNIPTPRTWLGREMPSSGFGFPLFVKPRYGSAGKQGFRAQTPEQLRFFLEYVPDPVVQPFVEGAEVTSDVFCSLEGQVWAVVSRRRIEVRWGEVAKGETLHDATVQSHCLTIAGGLKAVGPITVQCLMQSGQPLFTEINARFAGGAPLAFAAGVPAPRWYLEQAAGRKVTPPPLGSYRAGLSLTRYDESFFLDEDARARLARRGV
ncbi:MAG TPA: ATP-grasp domain-containing protein [Anaerolineales bacterium]|nr:ATP-grasp domain-containing protein [Anaerolineales bacterium]